MLNAITLVPAEISAVYNPYLQEFFYTLNFVEFV